MIRTIRSLTSFALAFLLIFSLAACGDKAATTPDAPAKESTAPPNPSAPPDAKSDAPAATAAASTGEALGFEAIVVPFPDAPLMQYPLDTGGKITIWMPLHSTLSKYYQNTAESATVKQITKDTGIEVTFIHPPSGQEKENFNLLVVSDSLPDIVVDASKHYAGGDVSAVSDGVFADLTDLVAQNAPDYNYFLQNNDLFRKLATTPDGFVYSLYNYKDVQAPYYHRPQFRKDWLDEWGMDIPYTLDEYEAYFDKVLETKPDIAPYTPVKNGLDGVLLGTFNAGGQDNGRLFFVTDGKIHHAYNEPGLKEYLTRMNSWYNKGYISKDFMAIDDVSKEFGNGRAGFVFGNSDVVYTLAPDLGAIPVSGRYPRLNPDDPYHYDIFYFPQNGNPNAISAKSPNKELALNWLNYSYTKQGSGVANFGETGVTWEMGADGVPAYTDYALTTDDYPMSDKEFLLRLHVCWSKYRYGDDVSMIRNVAMPDAWAYRERWHDDETVDNAWALPPLSFSADAANESGKLVTDLNTYAEEMCLKYITGASDLGDYDEFITTIEQLGMTRLLQIYQEAYDNFLTK